jgi:hypothetical protein
MMLLIVDKDVWKASRTRCSYTEVTSQTAVVCLMLRSYPASFRRPAAKELGFGVLYPELGLQI